MTIIEADFLADMSRELRDILSAEQIAVPASAAPEAVAIAYCNARRRWVAPRHRRVIKSRELLARLAGLDPELRAGLAQIERRAKNAGDLRVHLQRTMDSAEYHDLLLNDWGIHHFHLGTKLEQHGYVTRTGPLLFALVRPDALYWIDVLSHGAWTDLSLLEIVHRNWPDILRPHRAPPSLVGIVDEPSPSERQQMRRAGLMSAGITMSDGTIYISPGRGYSTTGLSMHALTTADELLHNLHETETWVRAAGDIIGRSLAVHGLPPKRATLRVAMRDHGWRIIDRCTALAIQIDVLGGVVVRAHTYRDRQGPSA